MASSQNGWSVNPSLIRRYTVPETSVKIALRSGDAATVLLEVLRRFNKEVQPLRQVDTGGYANRRVRGSSSISNHASGTAVDARWQAHPIGRRNTFTLAQRGAIRQILASMGGVVRWGGDYKGRPDEMHFEINAGSASVARQANRIRAGKAKPTKPAPVKPVKPSPVPTLPRELRQGNFGGDVTKLQTRLKQRGWNISIDGNFGPATTKIVKAFQKEKGLKVDGVVGSLTWNKLWTSAVT